MMDILVVGHAQTLRINRKVFLALADRGWSLEFAIPDRVPPHLPPIEDIAAGEPPLNRFTPLGNSTRSWIFQGLADFVRSRKPKIVFLDNDPYCWMARDLSRAAKTYGGKVVCLSVENDMAPIFQSLRAGNLKPAARTLRNRLWCIPARRWVDHVFVVSNEGAQIFGEMGFRTRVTRIPLGFDPRLFKECAASERENIRQQWRLTKTTIGYFGRLIPEKGIHVLIDALASLKHLEWQLFLDHLTDTDQGYPKLLAARLAQHGLSERTVQFHARHDEMPVMMNAVDIAVVPSIWKEQYGRVVPEAMACGRAVIITNSGALPELLGGCGLCVQQGDERALAAALERLLSDPEERSRLGAAAAIRAHSELSISRQVEIMDSALRELVRKRN